MGKWLIVFFDAIMCVLSIGTAETIMPCSAYFMVDTVYDVNLMTDVQKSYVLRSVGASGLGCMLTFFAGGLGLFGLHAPEEVIGKIKLPGF